MNRREAIRKLMFMSLGALMVRQNNAQAKEIKNCFIQFNLYGAPSRLSFDSILTPFGEDIKLSPLVGNKFSNGKLSYELVKYKNYRVPEILANSAKDFLKNTIIVRGINPTVNGHPECNIQTVYPRGARESLHSSIGKKTGGFYPVIQLGSTPSTRSFKSNDFQPLNMKLEKSQQDIVEKLTGALSSNSFKDIERKKTRKELLKEALSILSENIDGRQLENLKQSSSFLEKDVEKTISSYLKNEKKYHKIISNALGEKIKDITSIDLVRVKKDIRNKSEAQALLKLDDNLYFGGNDTSEVFKNSSYQFLIRQFAMTETLIENEIGMNIQVSANNEMGVLIENPNLEKAFRFDKKTKKIKKANREYGYGISMDTHRVGPIMELCLSSMYFHCLSLGISELRKTLIKLGLFDSTIINIASEFNRLPREDREGSEHNEKSATSMLISGKIKDFKIIGDLSLSDEREGLTGIAPRIDKYGRAIENKDIIKTICDFYGLDSPSPRAFSLIEWSKEAKTLLGKPKTWHV